MPAAAHPGWLYNGASPQLNLTHLVHRRRRTRGAVCSPRVPTEPSRMAAERDAGTGTVSWPGGRSRRPSLKTPRRDDFFCKCCRPALSLFSAVVGSRRVEEEPLSRKYKARGLGRWTPRRNRPSNLNLRSVGA